VSLARAAARRLSNSALRAAITTNQPRCAKGVSHAHTQKTADSHTRTHLSPPHCFRDPAAAASRAMPAIPAAPAVSPACTLLPRRSCLPVSSTSRPPPLPATPLRLPARPRAASMSAEARAPASPVAPPVHPTYDLKAVIALALSEDAGDRGTQSASLFAPLRLEFRQTTASLRLCHKHYLSGGVVVTPWVRTWCFALIS
jgi:hypothetical protein